MMKGNIKTKFKSFRGCQVKAKNESEKIPTKVFFYKTFMQGVQKH